MKLVLAYFMVFLFLQFAGAYYLADGSNWLLHNTETKDMVTTREYKKKARTIKGSGRTRGAEIREVFIELLAVTIDLSSKFLMINRILDEMLDESESKKRS